MKINKVIEGYKISIDNAWCEVTKTKNGELVFYGKVNEYATPREILNWIKKEENK